ncbi:MAG TPA: hypothetical protein V6D46_01150 [Coleofasciculaceae cyanobacterium]
MDWAAFGSGSQSIDRESAHSKQPVKKTAYCYILASIAQPLTTFALLKYAKDWLRNIKVVLAIKAIIQTSTPNFRDHLTWTLPQPTPAKKASMPFVNSLKATPNAPAPIFALTLA